MSGLSELSKKAQQFDIDHNKTYPPGTMAIWAGVIAFMPNGNCIFVGGFNADNVEEKRQLSMDLWHKKIRYQVRYGGVHYWLGESISQSITEAGAFTDDFEQFFRDIKKTVDPNYLLSPNKFHLHSYESKFSDYVIPDEE
jgi:hypothetical protein